MTFSSLFAGSPDEIAYQYRDYFHNADTGGLGPEHDETPSFPRVYTETFTQLHPGVIVGRRYGSFAGRTSAAAAFHAAGTRKIGRAIAGFGATRRSAAGTRKIGRIAP